MNDNRAAAIDELSAERARLARQDGRRSGGRALARALTAALDRAIIQLLPDLPQSGVAVLAVGGYGRADLSLHSDIDLLVLCSHHDQSVERIANDLFYALWDTGLQLLPAVRTVAEERRLAAKDLPTSTATLESRLLAGDAALYADFCRLTLSALRNGNAKRFLEALAAENAGRRNGDDSASYVLEPDIKNGPGGLRDAQSLRWAGVVKVGAADPSLLAAAGYLSEYEAESIEAAVELLLRVRHALHALTNRKTDRLAHAYQTDVATHLGYPSTGSHSPAETLMREVQARLDVVNRAVGGLWERLSTEPGTGPLPAGPSVRRRLPEVFGANDTTCIRDGRLYLSPGYAVPSQPTVALAAFAEAACRGVTASHTLIRALTASLNAATPPKRWSDIDREHFFALLRAGERSATLLEDAAACGLLQLLVPEWGRIRHLVRQDPLHRYTVDRHSVLVVRELNRLAAGDGPDGSLGASIAGDVENFDLLLLAGLLHDVGKAERGDHSALGADIVTTIGERAGLGSRETETLAFLVRHHLDLVRSATRRDLDDHALIVDLAVKVGTGDRLRMLYLLTVADSLATGENVWSEWKATLTRDLFFRVLNALETGGQRSQDAALAAKREALRAGLATLFDESTIGDFLTRMPEAYISSQSAQSAAEHLSMFSDTGDNPIRFRARQASDGFHLELTLVAADRPGLLWRVCGVLALHGVNILEARAFTDSGGTALDIFRLADAFSSRIDDEKLEAMLGDLSLALQGRLSLAYRLSRKLRHYRVTAQTHDHPTRIRFDNASSEVYTVIEVQTLDRLGLLYHLTRALSDLDLDIQLAKVSTRGPEAIDAFYVRDAHGRKIDSPDMIGEVRRAIEYGVSTIDRL